MIWEITMNDDMYISLDMFQGDESDVKCRTVKMRMARKKHVCFGNGISHGHMIDIGQRYRHERALIDGSFWGEYRICIPCLDEHIKLFYGENHDE